ncbi:MAG: YeeE/YedE family protein [Spirochaetes bacterium]|nr:YeeE/YedE family protein [Spirochaetota bacterium]
MLKKIKKVYVLGALLGVLAVVSALATTWLLERTLFIGTSTSFVRAAGFIERIFAPEAVYGSTLYNLIGIRIDWQFMLVIGIAIGAFISSMLSRTFKIEFVPPIWRERFGSSIVKRGLFAFLGGVIAIYGARLADGCPSGHGISGLMQLTASSFIAMFLFFAVGILVARIIYKEGGSGK